MRVAFMVMLILYIVLAIGAHQIHYFTIDYEITHDVQAITFPGFYTLMIFLSDLGSNWVPFALTGVVSLALILKGHRYAGIVCAAGVGLSAAFNALVKIIVARPRPTADLVHLIGSPHHNSFSSGHTVFYVTFFGFLIFLSYIFILQQRLRWTVIVLLSLMISLIGVSRIFEGAHWASDVIGGYLAGGLWLILMMDAYRRLQVRRQLHSKVASEPVINTAD
jgi:undecaprenyl-diphosphatase